MLCQPPRTPPTGSAFSDIRLGHRQSARAATSDVQNCFHQFAVPPKFGSSLSWKKVRARDVGIDMVAGQSVGTFGSRLHALFVVPGPSLNFCQQADVSVALRAGVLVQSPLLDRGHLHK